MTESLPTVTSNHREYKVISSIDNDKSSHGFISYDDVDNNQDTTNDNNDLDDKILTMIRDHRYEYSSSSSSNCSTVDETVDMEINDDKNGVDYDDYENNKKNHRNKNIKNESTYDDDDNDSIDYGMIEMRIINNKIEYVKVDDHDHKDSNISRKSSSSSSSSSSVGGVINNKMVLRDPKVLLATANYGNYQSQLLCLFIIIIIIIFNILLYYHHIIIMINNAIIKIIIIMNIIIMNIIIDNIITIVVNIIITTNIIFIIIITTIIIIINGNSIIIIIIIMINIGVLSAASIIIDETLPLFLKADISDGGLSFSSFHIGLLIAISSFIMVSINTLL